MQQSYNEKHPWGKPGPNSTIVGVTPDNYSLAIRARQVRDAMRRGESVSLEDAKFVADREEMIAKIGAE